MAKVSVNTSFNPPSGFVLFRSTIELMKKGSAKMFQSAKRICAVSKHSGRLTDVVVKCFNPPSGFVLFRSRLLRLGRLLVVSFNPPSGFVLFRREWSAVEE